MAADYVSISQQYDFLLRIPDIDSQRSIACILCTLDDKIELNRRMNRTLEKMAQAIFKSWFVDFDGQTEFEDSRTELGEIPFAWNVGPLSRLATLRTDSVQPSSAPEQLWEHYSIPAFDEREHPSKELGGAIRSGKYRVPPMSILASKLNPRFPRIWMPVVEDPEHAVCSTEFMPFVPRQAGWRFFVYELLRSAHVQNVIQSRATGTTSSRQRVRPSAIAEMDVLIPPPERIEAFAALAGPLYEKRWLNLAQSRTLAELRDTLLPKLISGEIRVPEAESSVESAL
jgi:type I restriction enzyme S subunit